jgi:anti-sigma regulatory factor (Ser/Thr protein kinase)
LGEIVRIPIRVKLAGALAVPLCALIAMATVEVLRADARAEDVRAETELATAAVGPGSLITTLQDERNFSGVSLLGLNDALVLGVTSFEQARGLTDEARAQMDEFVAAQPDAVAAYFTDGIAAIDDELIELRELVDGSTAVRDTTNATFANEIFDRYTALIQVLIDDTSGIALDIDDASLRTGVELVNLATLNYETNARVVRSILLPFLTGDTSVDARIDVASLVARSRTEQGELMERSIGEYDGVPELDVKGAANIAQFLAFDEFIATGATDVDTLAGAVSGDAEGSVNLRGLSGEALAQDADRLVTEAETSQRNVLIVALALTALALASTVLATRSITRPLRSLTKQAREMAGQRLPNAVQDVLDTPLGEDVSLAGLEPISVHTKDEVADVATALNTVQRSALDLAVEQAALRRNLADSFVNLGRRNQNLLDRQLDFISDLESAEEDPEHLEDLFKLDHLATRMRRNAESLLRLAGGGDTTQNAWGGPIPIGDVIRSAMGEIENFQRVEITSLDDAIVTASVGSDLSHAIAELVENALSFSADDETVGIRGRRTDSGYVVAIIDRGVGMSAEQLAVANRRLAGDESFTVAPSRYLGHYVAGHLAYVHGMKIELESDGAGITARIELPSTLLVDHAAASV